MYNIEYIVDNEKKKIYHFVVDKYLLIILVKQMIFNRLIHTVIIFIAN